MIQRERSIDIDSLSPEQADHLAVQIGEKVKEICDEAVEKANKILAVYGMSAKMQIVLDHKGLVKEGDKKKRGRPRKAPNL